MEEKNAISKKAERAIGEVLARVHQENAVSEGLDNDFIRECPRCLSTTVFDRYSYVKYLEGRGWDLSDYDKCSEQIMITESHAVAGGVSLGASRLDREGDTYTLCGDCVASFDRRDKAGFLEGADSWPRK